MTQLALPEEQQREAKTVVASLGLWALKRDVAVNLLAYEARAMLDLGLHRRASQLETALAVLQSAGLGESAPG